jgi:hypothetical protein
MGTTMRKKRMLVSLVMTGKLINAAIGNASTPHCWSVIQAKDKSSWGAAGNLLYSNQYESEFPFSL